MHLQLLKSLFQEATEQWRQSSDGLNDEADQRLYMGHRKLPATNMGS